VCEGAYMDSNHGRKISSEKKITLEVGELRVYNYYIRKSAGIDARCIIDNPAVIAIVDDHLPAINRKQQQLSFKNEKSFSAFVFRAICPGRATIIIQHGFNGNLLKVEKISVIVK